MATQQYFVGSVGPLLYDDSVNDAFHTTGKVSSGSMILSTPGTTGADAVSHSQMTSVLAGYQIAGSYALLGSGTSLPVASSAFRGTFFNVLSALGTADQLWFCIKNAADAYVWQQLI